ENETYTDGQGGTGNLPGIPLNNHTFSAGPGAPVGVSHSRSSTWNFSGKQSRIFLDARTPSPYGEVKAYIEFDFAASNTNTILNNNQGSVNGYIPRLRQGYATLGGLLMGQTQGTFTDNDSEPELLDFGGQTGTPFVSRTPQVRYTYPLAYGMSVAVAAENPSPNFAGPFGTFFTDTNQIPTAASCAALTTPAINGTATGTAVLATTIVSWSGRIGYQHWWTPELRSTVDFSVNHSDVPALVQASGRAANNKELALSHINLIWSPVAFVDVGIEGGWGHREV